MKGLLIKDLMAAWKSVISCTLIMVITIAITKVLAMDNFDSSVIFFIIVFCGSIISYMIISDDDKSGFLKYMKILPVRRKLVVMEKFIMSMMIMGIFSTIGLIGMYVNESFSSTVNKLSDNQSTLATAITEASDAFEKTTEISQSLSDSYDEQAKKINESISRFSDILNEYKETSRESKELLEGYKGMDINIAKIFNQINENTEGYSKIIGDSLEKYLKGFKDATKDISKQFADATLALSEEVRRLNGASDSTKA